MGALSDWLNARDLDAPARLTPPPATGRVLVIGRSRWCDLPLAAPRISRQHASLRHDGEGWTLADLGSTNGTFVNGWRVGDPTPVAPGDEIRLGDTALVFAPRRAG